MLLAVDVGNSHTVLGIFKGKRLIDEWRMQSRRSRKARELWEHVLTFAGEAGAAPRDIEGVVISSVVPALTRTFAAMTKKYLKMEPVIISGGMDAGIPVLYDDPSRLGPDRLCNAVAALAIAGAPSIVIDLGTATTFDVVSPKGEYLGGLIAPGVESAAAGLYSHTAQLRPVPLEFPERVVGSNTVTGMQSGIMYGALAGVEGLVRRIEEAIGEKAPVIATGGYAEVFAEKSSLITRIEPALVLEGARLIYERVTRKKRKTR
jgi:type III pantothenate kinase